MQPLEHKVLEAIRRHGLLADGEGVVLALSGGPDSVALALAMIELRAARALDVRLRLAHLNHCLRGTESDADEEFCRRFAAAHGLEIDVERTDVAAEAARRRRSVEAQARASRYDFLARCARTCGASAVATGHHADDVAETVLLRLLRGAGVLGLGAMARQRPLSPAAPGLRLVRPLLDVRKRELLDYLTARGQPCCTDRSNLDTDYTRNRVRHALIPALERDFPTFSVRSLCALNESAVEATRLLDRMVDEAWPGLCRKAGEREAVFDAQAFTALDGSVRKAAAARALRMLGGGAMRALRAEHLRDLSALPEAAVGAELALPGGLFARREHGLVYFGRRVRARGLAPRALPIPGAVDVAEAGLRIECAELPPGALSPAQAAERASDHEVFVDRAGIAGPLTVRSRRRGDRFRPLGAPGTARLKEFLINQKVPRHERDRTPLVTTAAGEIVWVVGCRIGEPFKLTGSGGPVLRLRASPLRRS